MRRICLVCLLGFAMLGLSKGQRQLAEANIPFDFHAGQSVLPAGQYMVSESRDVLTIRGAAGRPTIMLLTLPDSRPLNDTGSDPKLFFQRYGSEYFLSKVWNGDSSIARAVPKCKQEREIAKRMELRKGEEVVLEAQNGHKHEAR